MGRKLKTKQKVMIAPITWAQFQDIGMVWYVNLFLAVFGLAIVIKTDKKGRSYAQPVRTRFRGFDTDINDDGYRKISRYMEMMAPDLREEAEE